MRALPDDIAFSGGLEGKLEEGKEQGGRGC